MFSVGFLGKKGENGKNNGPLLYSIQKVSINLNLRKKKCTNSSIQKEAQRLSLRKVSNSNRGNPLTAKNSVCTSVNNNNLYQTHRLNALDPAASKRNTSSVDSTEIDKKGSELLLPLRSRAAHRNPTTRKIRSSRSAPSQIRRWNFAHWLYDYVQLSRFW